MANELQVTGLVTFTKSPASSASLGSSSAAQFNVTGTRYVRSTQSIPTDAGGTAIDKGGMAGTNGWCYIKNLDTTNYVEILTGVGGTVFLKLKPGEFFIGRLGCAAPAAQANTGAVVIEYLLVED